MLLAELDELVLQEERVRLDLVRNLDSHTRRALLSVNSRLCGERKYEKTHRPDACRFSDALNVVD